MSLLSRARPNPSLRFVDLFAGLGGFHLALRQLGHRCVFACEIDPVLRSLYQRNLGMLPAGDIRQVHASDIPDHDVLCAGFPCQPFSKAGSQQGSSDPELGELYKEIVRIISYKRPKHLILENVPNLERHDNGRTWALIESLLRDQGYDVRVRRLSPHQFGIPQIRDRVYIVGSRATLASFKWPDPDSSAGLSIRSVLEPQPGEARVLSEQVRKCLQVWQEFLDLVPTDEGIPHPLWSMEFGATYPYEGTTPSRVPYEELRSCRGSHGRSLSEARTKEELMTMLPSHARRDQEEFPSWKVRFIRKNREFYQRHRQWLDLWVTKIIEFAASFQKLEWNCQGEKDRDLTKYILQIRPSGVRVKRPTTAPSLVAMTTTQVPIITWEGRYMTPAECSRLQSMDDLELPSSLGRAYEALGNAVNVEVATRVAISLLGSQEG
jgi:DNA (cytosine-5)-methyltransferase 1